jgi:hypothetical protein
VLINGTRLRPDRVVDILEACGALDLSSSLSRDVNSYFFSILVLFLYFSFFFAYFSLLLLLSLFFYFSFVCFKYLYKIMDISELIL